MLFIKEYFPLLNNSTVHIPFNFPLLWFIFYCLCIIPGFHTGFLAGRGGKIFCGLATPICQTTPRVSYRIWFHFLGGGGGELCIIIAFLLERGE